MHVFYFQICAWFSFESHVQSICWRSWYLALPEFELIDLWRSTLNRLLLLSLLNTCINPASDCSDMPALSERGCEVHVYCARIEQLSDIRPSQWPFGAQVYRLERNRIYPIALHVTLPRALLALHTRQPDRRRAPQRGRRPRVQLAREGRHAGQVGVGAEPGGRRRGRPWSIKAASWTV